VQRHARSTDFLDQRFAAVVDLIEIGRAPRRVGCAGEDEVGNFQVADGAVHRVGDAADFFRDSKRCFAGFIGRSDVADDRRVNRAAVNDHRVVAHLRVFRFGEAAGHDDEWIGRADQEAELLQLLDTIARLGDRAFSSLLRAALVPF
jgi:hypothetical protein